MRASLGLSGLVRAYISGTHISKLLRNSSIWASLGLSGLVRIKNSTAYRSGDIGQNVLVEKAD